MIEARVLGPVQISVDGGAPPAEMLWRKNLALLVYLACSPTRGRSREHLVGLLWPDRPEKSARNSLKEALYEIRPSLGEHGLVTQADHVRLTPGAVRLDTEQFVALTASGDWAGAAALVSGSFLEGFAVPEASAFEEWLAAERRDWGRRTVDMLLRHAEAELGRGRVGEAAGATIRAMKIAPLSETAVMTLMRALALDGDRAGALQEFESLGVRLTNELGTHPSAACAELADRIRRERGQRGPRAPGPVPERRRAPLVGRAAELEHVGEVWRRCATAGTSGAAILVGDAGVGKTRLGDEVAARLRLDGVTTAVIRAVESDLAEPWSGLLGLARGGLLDAAGLAGAAPAALAWFAERIPEWTDRFPVAGRTTPEGSPGRAFSEVLRVALAEQPIGLVVDDAELLDRDSLLALGAALRDLAKCRFFVLLSTTAHAARSELDELGARLGRDVDGVIVRLAPLGAGDIKTLARWAVPSYGDADLDRLTRRVGTDSAGLPLLVVELLNAVALGLDLEKICGAWPEPFHTLDQTLPGDLPEGVVAAIRVEFRRLTPSAQRVLLAAAVLEARVTVHRLIRATALASEVVAEALDKLEWGRWLTADGRGYAFVARIVRQVVDQDLITPGQRQRFRDAAGPTPGGMSPPTP